jgi:hypothetical protein
MIRHRSRALWFFAPAVMSILASGCSSSHIDEKKYEPTGVAECDAYVSAYHACLSRLDKGAQATVDQRVLLTRDTFAAGAADEAGRARMKATCASNLQRLKASCP